MTEVHNQEIHMAASTSIASAQGWHALYSSKADLNIQMALPLACWSLIQTRQSNIEMPKEQLVPLVMGMIVDGEHFRLINAPMRPGWVFRRYLTDDERDDFYVQKAQEDHNERIAKQELGTAPIG